MPQRHASTKGFTRTSNLLTGRIRAASEQRGFAQARLLTHWTETVGENVAAIARPVEVSYGRGGFGATLTLLTTGAHAPMLEMEKEKLRAKVNAVYGYNAIARIRITQTAATGFEEGQVAFSPKAPRHQQTIPSAPAQAAAADTASPIADSDLRDALTRLGAHIMDKSNR
ncbi:MAG: DUF721 domain-containing protein [Pseudomonadota bacterium]